MTRPSLRLTGLLVALFVVGGALGFASGALYAFRHPWAPFGHKMGKTVIIDRLDRELHLSPEQRVKVQAVLERNFAELRKRREAARVEMKASRDSTQQAIEVLLDPVQKEKYRRIIDRMQARWGHSRSPGDTPE